MKISQGTLQNVLKALAYANAGNQSEFEALLSGSTRAEPKRNPARAAPAFAPGHFNHMPKPY